MSSLQKFHRRTITIVGVSPDSVVSIATMGDGSGDDSKGYYLGGFSDGQKMYVAPKSTEILIRGTGAGSRAWGSYGIIRGTTLKNNGLSNTNILAAFGSSKTTGHPAAHYCKYLTTGGYNTWYLPALNELKTMYSNHGKAPFVTSNSFQLGGYHMSSSECIGIGLGTYFYGAMDLTAGTLRTESSGINKNNGQYVRAVRRSMT